MRIREKTIYTIGHSNRPIEDFMKLLKAHQIETVIDIRSIPRSRHNPQFNQDKLKRSLKKEKIHYIHLEKLGGLRHPKKNSLNTGWENASFRGFADYMQTADFREGIKELIENAKVSRCALMCAEAVPWRCHRSLVADALTVKKWKVRHIQSRVTAKQHELTAFLKIKGRRLIYA
ncbi:MAG: DUF488 family protein [Parachlamydiales bacterium]